MSRDPIQAERSKALWFILKLIALPFLFYWGNVFLSHYTSTAPRRGPMPAAGTLPPEAAPPPAAPSSQTALPSLPSLPPLEGGTISTGGSLLADNAPVAKAPSGQNVPAVTRTRVEHTASSQPAAPQSKAQPAASAPTKAPEPAAIELKRRFSGSIGGQPVVMQLSFKEEAASRRLSVAGSYFLESQGSSKLATLSGTLQDGSLVMDQSAQGAITGSFALMNDSANKSVFVGSWRGQGRVLPVRLTAAR